MERDCAKAALQVPGGLGGAGAMGRSVSLGCELMRELGPACWLDRAWEHPSSPGGSPTPFSWSVPSVSAVSESSCGLGWGTSHYPSPLRGAREGRREVPTLELARAGNAPALTAPTPGPPRPVRFVLCGGGCWGWGGRAAAEQSPSLYYILKCSNSTMSIFVDGTDHLWKRAINLKGRGNNLAKVTLRQ